MYLCKRGANLESVDIYKNTPLGCALLAHHHNYGIIMIQRNANVKHLVHQEDPKRIEEMWKKEAEEKRQSSKQDDEDAEMESDDGNQKHRRLFDKNQSTKNVFFGYDSEDDDSDTDDSDDDSDDVFEQNAFNNQNAFNFQPY